MLEEPKRQHRGVEEATDRCRLTGPRPPSNLVDGDGLTVVALASHATDVRGVLRTNSDREKLQGMAWRRMDPCMRREGRQGHEVCTYSMWLRTARSPPYLYAWRMGGGGVLSFAGHIEIQ